jgi:hypothetical protein
VVKRLAYLLALCAACGGDSFQYSGAPGTPVAAHIGGDLLADVAVRVNGGAEHLFTVDTGAPMTILNSSTFSDHSDGVHRDDVTAFALTFKGLTDIAYKNYAGDGILGGDLLRHFALTVDYEGDRAWLSDPFSAQAVPADVAVDAERDVGFHLLGGGSGVAFSGCTGSACGLTYPATRVVVQARLEGASTPVWVMIDSGASIVLFDAALYASLKADPARPRLEGVQLVGVNDGPQTSFMTRVWRLELGEGAAGSGNVVDDLEVGVVPGWTLLQQLSAEAGRPVQALIGATYLVHHLVTVDYQAGLVRFARYSKPTLNFAAAFIGPGFQVDQAGTGWTAYEVYPNKDAYAKGLRVGDTIEMIGDLALTGQPPSVVQKALDSVPVGQEMKVTYSRDGSMSTVQVLVEDLLPHYPPPT